jgi:hypothetical protein
MLAYTIGQWIILLLVALFFFSSGAWFGRTRKEAIHKLGGEEDEALKKSLSRTSLPRTPKARRAGRIR